MPPNQMPENELHDRTQRSRVKELKKSLHFSLPQLLVFIVVFGCLGGYLIYRSFAAGPLVDNNLGSNQSAASPNGPPAHSPDELLVRFKAGSPQAVQNGLLNRYQANVTGEIPQIGVKEIRVPAKALDAVKTALSHNKAVDFAEYNGVTSEAETPNDPYFTNQWFLDKVQAPAAWGITHGSAATKVAILDTGINSNHPDLAGKVVATQNFSSSTTAQDLNGHGTHSAGMVSSDTNNGVGVASLGYNLSLENVKVLEDGGSGLYSNVISGITWATDNGANVINISLGGTLDSASLHSAVDYAWSKGVVVVAAAGNSASSTPFYPAAYPNVIAVAATTDVNKLASFSNFGDWVDVAAPGISLYSTGYDGVSPSDNYYDYQSGTSFSSPQVAALAGLLFGRISDTNHNGFVNDEIRAQIQNTATNIGVSGIGSGVINAYNAVNTNPVLPPPDTTPPVVSITSPTSGATVIGAVSVNATATDNTGVTKVEFYIDGSLPATVPSSPYSYYWDTTQFANGSHTLLVKAYDAAGNVGTSSVVTVTVNNTTPDTTPPTATVSALANGSTVSGTITVNASASDNVGVTSMELYIDGLLQASAQSGNLSFGWNTGAETNGSHTLLVKSYDAAGNVGTSSTVTVTVNNQNDTIAPVVVISNPVNSAVITNVKKVSVAGLATDNIKVTKMEIYVDGLLKTSSTSGTISYSWAINKNVKSGSHSVTVKAYDAAGNIGQSSVLVTK